MGGMILFNSTFYPSAKYTVPSMPRASSTAMAKAPPFQERQEADSGAHSIIDFTKKVACRHNVKVINTMVEVWYLQHDGEWPKLDLSDIGRDKDYFPRGLPRCPVNGEAYRLEPGVYRVLGHEHGDIGDPFGNLPAYEYKKEKPGRRVGQRRETMPGRRVGQEGLWEDEVPPGQMDETQRQERQDDIPRGQGRDRSGQ